MSMKLPGTYHLEVSLTVSYFDDEGRSEVVSEDCQSLYVTAAAAEAMYDRNLAFHKKQLLEKFAKSIDPVPRRFTKDE